MRQLYTVLKLIKRIVVFFLKKGKFFYLNLCITAGFAFLISPLFFDEQSPHSFTFFIYVGFLTILLVGFFLLIATATRQNNQRIFLGTLLIFFSLEVLLRVFWEEPHYHQDPFRFPKPYVMFTGKPNSTLQGNVKMFGKNAQTSSLITLNNLGFRIERELTKQKPENEIRVFMVGGSTVFNGEPLSNSIAGHLEFLFHQNGFPNVMVYNFGVVSYVSGQELTLLLHLLTDYHPDLVIAYNGGNEVTIPYYYDPRPGYPFNFLVYEEGIARVQGKQQNISQVLSALLYQSKLIRTFFASTLREQIVPIAQIRKNCDYQSQDWEMRIVQEYLNHMKKMCGLAKGFDFKLIVALQPLLNFKYILVGDEEDLASKRKDFQDYVERQYQRIRKQMNELNEQYDGTGHCFFVDMSFIMEGYDRETYWDFIHTDNEGNRFIASKLYSLIESKGILTPNVAKITQK